MTLDTVLVLDGGMSNVLEDRGHDLSSDLWTARLLLEDPGEVAAVHAAYFRAGADVATTASYQASVPGLVAAGLEQDRAEATRSAAASPSRARCATSWPRSSDGSCWWRRRSGRTAPTSRTARSTAAGTASPPPTLRDFHAPRLELLAAAGPDLLAVETIPDADEAEVLVPLLEELGLPAWFSYAVDRRHDPGRPAADRGVRRRGRLRAARRRRRQLLGPARRGRALRRPREVTGKPGVAYPNLGERWDNADPLVGGRGRVRRRARRRAGSRRRAP